MGASHRHSQGAQAVVLSQDTQKAAHQSKCPQEAWHNRPRGLKSKADSNWDNPLAAEAASMYCHYYVACANEGPSFASESVGRDLDYKILLWVGKGVTIAQQHRQQILVCRAEPQEESNFLTLNTVQKQVSADAGMEGHPPPQAP